MSLFDGLGNEGGRAGQGQVVGSPAPGKVGPGGLRRFQEPVPSVWGWWQVPEGRKVGKRPLCRTRASSVPISNLRHFVLRPLDGAQDFPTTRASAPARNKKSRGCESVCDPEGAASPGTTRGLVTGGRPARTRSWRSLHTGSLCPHLRPPPALGAAAPPEAGVGTRGPLAWGAGLGGSPRREVGRRQEPRPGAQQPLSPP